MPIRCALLSAEEILRFEDKCFIVIDPMFDAPHSIYTGLVDLDNCENGNSKKCEVWLSSNPIDRGDMNHVVWACDGNDLIASCEMEGSKPLRETVVSAYESILSAVEAFEGFSICRIWNYMHDINGYDPDFDGKNRMERYWDFNRSRLYVFSQFAACERYPAASAIGVTGQNYLYLHATKDVVNYFENPRQISAFEYPDQYGPASPSFSRATLVTGPSEKLIHISGTASIVGHETLFVGNIDGQLDTIFDNITLLLESISATAESDEAVELLLIKIYVRVVSTLTHIRARVEAQYPGVPKRYLRGDICRKDLLVEIEGVAELLKIER